MSIKRSFIVWLIAVIFFSVCFICANTHGIDMLSYFIGFLVCATWVAISYIIDCFVDVNEKDLQIKVIKTSKEKDKV